MIHAIFGENLSLTRQPLTGHTRFVIFVTLYYSLFFLSIQAFDFRRFQRFYTFIFVGFDKEKRELVSAYTRIQFSCSYSPCILYFMPFRLVGFGRYDIACRCFDESLCITFLSRIRFRPDLLPLPLQESVLPLPEQMQCFPEGGCRLPAVPSNIQP